VQFVALDDLNDPTAGAGSGSRDAGSLVAGIGKDALYEGEEAARAPVENQRCPVAVLHVGGVDNDVQQKPERIDRDLALAPRDFLPASNRCGSSAEPLFEPPWRSGCR